MKKFLAGALIALASVLSYKSCADSQSEKGVLREQSALIQRQLQQVSKLIVTEGHFAEVYNYADSRELFGSLLTADKKALVVVNAEVRIAYDLEQLAFTIDSTNRTVVLQHIPQPEVIIDPDFEYYDISADYFNPFGAEDYNTIKRRVKQSLHEKIEASGLLSNAETRLITELHQLLILTQSMGWTLQYQEEPLSDLEGLQQFLD